MTHILWLHSDRTGCGTYRCYVPALSLGKYDHNFLLHSACLPHNLKQLDGMDLVVFQRAAAPIFVEWAKECRRRGIKVVWEMDDDLFNIPRANPSSWYWHKRDTQRTLRKMIDLSDHLIVSTPPLREETMIKTGRKDVTTCFNHLHPSVWGPDHVGGVQQYENGSHTILGWQGSNTHDADFRMALPALVRILADYPQVLVRFFGSIPLSVKGHIPESRFQWARGVPFDRYPATLKFMHYHIGLAPITPSKFNKAKSNLKWLEYSSLGIPCVASNVYPYGVTGITHGVDGYLATTEDEWYAALAALIESDTLRQQIGEAAKVTAWADWGPTRAATWDTVFTSVLGEGAADDQPMAELTGTA